MADVNVVLVPADDDRPVARLTVDQSAAAQDVAARIGAASIDLVSLEDPAALVITNGDIAEAPVNVRATRIAERFRPGFAMFDRLRGDVLVTGALDGGGAYTDVPDEVAGFANRIDRSWV